MVKKAQIIAFIAILAGNFAFCGNLSAEAPINQEIPQKNGVYDVPGNAKLKMRVFVHYPKENLAKSPHLPSCNVPDPDSAQMVGHNPGSIATENWSYSINYSSAPSSISKTDLKTLIHSAFAEWQTKTDLGTKITFTDAGSTTTASYNPLDGKNVIAWGNVQAGALAVTAAVYDPETGKMAETDTIFSSNKKIKWDWTPYSLTACADALKYDAQNVLTHEIGHWIGLKDEYGSEYSNSTMYGYASTGEIKKDTLATGDIYGANTIY